MFEIEILEDEPGLEPSYLRLLKDKKFLCGGYVNKDGEGSTLYASTPLKKKSG